VANVYNNAMESFLNATIDLDDGGSTYKVMLLRADGTWSPAYDPTNVTMDDVKTEAGNGELAVSGYTAGGGTDGTMGTIVVSQDDANTRAEAKASKLTFQTLATGQTVGAAVLYQELGTDGQDLAIAFYDLTDTPTNGGNIEVRWNNVDGTGAFLRLLYT
jgi:hypothetical protein